MADVKSFFSAREAALLGGVRPTMVDYLCRAGLLVPTHGAERGYGIRRCYSFGDVVVLRGLARILQAGVSVLRLQRDLKALRRRHPEITPDSLPAPHLVSDGRHIYFANGNAALEAARDGQYAFAFLVEMTRVQHEVLAQLYVERVSDRPPTFNYRLRSGGRRAVSEGASR